jgi:pyrimidine operon attenuation protein / uracil phosphoribosyltransferase
MTDKVKILDNVAIGNKLLRMAYEIVENNFEEKEIVLAGITDRGIVIATALQQQIEKISKIKIQNRIIKIDKSNPVDCSLDDASHLDHKSIIIVDDVANSGRTLLYALNPFLNIIAKKIQIAVLVDRQHKNYPIAPDYTGLSISTTLQEHISVEVKGSQILGAFLI